MKQLAKSIIFILSLLIMVVSCDNSAIETPADTASFLEEPGTPQWDDVIEKEKQATIEARQLLQTIKDSDFLQTTEPMSERLLDLDDPAIMLKEKRAYNGAIYYKALERVRKHSYVKDNQIYTALKSGAEVNIAEDLFDFITNFLYVKWNEIVKTDDIFEFINDEQELITLGVKERETTKSTQQSYPLDLVPMSNSARYTAVRDVYWIANTGEYPSKYFFLNFGEQIFGGSGTLTCGVRNWCESYGNPDNLCSHNMFVIIDGAPDGSRYRYRIGNANWYTILYYYVAN